MSSWHWCIGRRHTATHCNSMHPCVIRKAILQWAFDTCVLDSNTLRHIATHCNSLQHTSTHFQHTSTHHVYIHMYIYMYTEHTFPSLCTPTNFVLCVHLYMYMYVHIYSYMYVYMYTCIFIHIYTNLCTPTDFFLLANSKWSHLFWKKKTIQVILVSRVDFWKIAKHK